MKVAYILKFDYEQPEDYWVNYKIDNATVEEMLEASIASVRKHITNDIIVVSDREIPGVRNVKIEGNPYHDRIFIIHQLINEFNDDILFVEHDVIFLKNPNINEMFFNVGSDDFEPFGEILYFEKDKINEYIYIYVYIYI